MDSQQGKVALITVSNRGIGLETAKKLGGPHAPMKLADSWKTSVRLATLDKSGPTGEFFN